MMFSCKVYPFHDPSFIEESIIEVSEQVSRLQHHASIVFWDLNNEGEAMTNWGNPGNWTIYRDQY
jgi:beta-galactosidase/beta-glucuronidase